MNLRVVDTPTPASKPASLHPSAMPVNATPVTRSISTGSVVCE